jgi:hypothetical protein
MIIWLYMCVRWRGRIMGWGVQLLRTGLLSLLDVLIAPLSLRDTNTTQNIRFSNSLRQKVIKFLFALFTPSGLSMHFQSVHFIMNKFTQISIFFFRRVQSYVFLPPYILAFLLPSSVISPPICSIYWIFARFPFDITCQDEDMPLRKF